jgi:hypothetical protein
MAAGGATRSIDGDEPALAAFCDMRLWLDTNR